MDRQTEQSVVEDGCRGARTLRNVKKMVEREKKRSIFNMPDMIIR